MRGRLFHKTLTLPPAEAGSLRHPFWLFIKGLHLSIPCINRLSRFGVESLLSGVSELGWAGAVFSSLSPIGAFIFPTGVLGAGRSSVMGEMLEKSLPSYGWHFSFQVASLK